MNGPYDNVELKTYDDLINKFSSTTTTQCQGKKYIRDFGIDFSGVISFCNELSEIHQCLELSTENADPDAIREKIQEIVKSLSFEREDSVSNAFDLWNGSPEATTAVCDGIDALLGLMGGSGSFGVGAMVGAIYAKSINYLDDLVSQVIVSGITELIDAALSFLTDFICENLYEAVECLKNNLLAQPWDCLSVIDASHLEVVKSINAEDLCRDFLATMDVNKIGNITTMAKSTISGGTLALKSFGTAALASIPASVDNLYSLPSLSSVSNLTTASCRDIAELVDNIVNHSFLGIAVALGQALYNNYQFLNGIDFKKLTDDLLDCMELKEMDELCELAAKIVNLKGVISSFSKNILQNLDFACDVVSGLHDFLDEDAKVLRLLEYADDRHSPMRNGSTCASVSLLLKLDAKLNNDTISDIKEAMNNAVDTCVDTDTMLTNINSYTTLDYMTEIKLSNMVNVYYEDTKCLTNPVDFNDFVVTLNNTLDNLDLNPVREC
jgi:hypothetical protein